MTNGDAAPPPDDEPTEPEAKPPPHQPATLRDILKGDPVSPATSAHIDKLLGDLQGSIGKIGQIQSKTSTAAAAYQRAEAAREAARAAARRDDQSMSQLFDAQALARRRELEWRDNLLSQQSITAQVLTEMKDAQVADRRTNVWVLRIAIASLAVGLLGIIVAVIIALLQ